MTEVTQLGSSFILIFISYILFTFYLKKKKKVWFFSLNNPFQLVKQPLTTTVSLFSLPVHNNPLFSHPLSPHICSYRILLCHCAVLETLTVFARGKHTLPLPSSSFFFLQKRHKLDLEFRTAVDASISQPRDNHVREQWGLAALQATSSWHLWGRSQLAG